MEGNTRITVLSVDDHPLLREGLVAIIENEDDMVVVAQASCGEDGIREYSSMRPDITLMDLRLPDMSGIDALVAIRQVDPSARIIMLTMSEGDAEIQRAPVSRRRYSKRPCRVEVYSSRCRGAIG